MWKRFKTVLLISGCLIFIVSLFYTLQYALKTKRDAVPVPHQAPLGLDAPANVSAAGATGGGVGSQCDKLEVKIWSLERDLVALDKEIIRLKEKDSFKQWQINTLVGIIIAMLSNFIPLRFKKIFEKTKK